MPCLAFAFAFAFAVDVAFPGAAFFAGCAKGALAVASAFQPM